MGFFKTTSGKILNQDGAQPKVAAEQPEPVKRKSDLGECLPGKAEDITECVKQETEKDSQ